MMYRACAVAAAIMFVVAFALATLSPTDMTLGDGMQSLELPMVQRAEAGLRAHVSKTIWDDVIDPLLQRPVWLPPVALGLLFGGAALSASTARGGTKPRRRRS